jgi:hypothetical protein
MQQPDKEPNKQSVADHLDEQFARIFIWEHEAIMKEHERLRGDKNADSEAR